MDVRYVLRVLKKNPGFSAVAVLLFALGIGVNTAIFSVANAVLFRPLPYAHPERLMVALHNGAAPVSPADFFDYQKLAHSFEQMAAAQAWGGSMAFGDRREAVPGLQISPNMLELLGVAPMLCHGFNAKQDDALLLSYSLWKSRFNGDQSIMGRSVSIDHKPYTVVGVMPSSFRFAPFWATRAQMWVPLNLNDRLGDRDGRSLRVFARLRPGVTRTQAQAEMDMIAGRLAKQYPNTNAKLGITVLPLAEKVVGSVRPTLLALMGTVGFVLLIACATVGNLMLSRSVGRRREMALRLAVGARSMDLVRITMTEVLVLASLGAFGGLLLGSWAMQMLNTMLPPGSIPRQTELAFDGPALVFGLCAALLSALLAGILPSIEATRASLDSNLRSGRGSTHGAGQLRSQSALIALEIAVSLLLMAGAGLMMRTMLALTSVDAGFNPHGVLTMQVSISGTDYDRNERRANVFRELRNHLAADPQITSVSATNHLPLGGDTWTLGYTISGRPKPLPGQNQGAVYRVIMPGYLQTMQIPLVKGRDFSDHDNEHAQPVAIINEGMARRQFGGNPIGQTIYFGVSPDDAKVGRTIVGVAKSVRQSDWTSAPGDEIYLPYYEVPDTMGVSSYLTFVVRTRTASEAVTRELGAFDKNLTISEIVTMDRIIADELWRQRLASVLIGAFAAVALFLAASGIYGVISHSVRQRTKEMGIRIALGAHPSDLVRLTLWEGMQPVLIGLILGALSAAFLTRFLDSLLYGVTSTDMSTFVLVAAALLAVSIAANVLPAMRATRIDPTIALRHD